MDILNNGCQFSFLFLFLNINILYCAIKTCQIEINKYIFSPFFQMPIVIIGGPTATGKTCTAKKLGEIYNWHYVEADEYHSKENINKMHAGIPLTDEDRLPWLESLHEQLKIYSAANKSCIMTCSALKKCYRQILLTGSADPAAKADVPTKDFYLIMLTLSRETLHMRLLQRQAHFMAPSLLDSQLETLELPKSWEDEPHTHIVKCDGLSLDEVVQEIQKIVKP